MPSVIYTNTASLAAQRNLLGAQNSLTTSVERLSSGLRLNRAKDDAAGLGVAESLQKQLNGIKQGIQNINDGISMSQTAEGALAAVSAMAQRMVTLATQGSNETLSVAQRTSIYSEIVALQTAINDAAERTTFTGTSLFAGNSLSIQVSNIKEDAVKISATSLAKVGVVGKLSDTGSDPSIGGAWGLALSSEISVLKETLVPGYTPSAAGAAATTDARTAYTAALTAYNSALTTYNSDPSVTASKTALTTATATLDGASTSLIAAAKLSTTITDAFKNVQETAASFLDAITKQRGELGAFQNQLEYTVSNLTDFSSNLSAARSRVIDTDYAAETANLTKGQILQQAATAMLAQANQMPNVILTLMK